MTPHASRFTKKTYLCSTQPKEKKIMVIEKIDNEIIVRIPADVMEIEDLQRMLDLIKLNEIAAKSQATQEEIDRIAKEAKKGWWAANRDRFIHS
jgi:hypothetical protein